MEYYSTIKKNEILPFAATWIDVEGIMLSEMSDKERKILYITHLWNLKKKLVNITKRRQTLWYREQTSGYQWGQGKGRGSRG